MEGSPILQIVDFFVCIISIEPAKRDQAVFSKDNVGKRTVARNKLNYAHRKARKTAAAARNFPRYRKKIENRSNPRDRSKHQKYSISVLISNRTRRLDSGSPFQRQSASHLTFCVTNNAVERGIIDSRLFEMTTTTSDGPRCAHCRCNNRASVTATRNHRHRTLPHFDCFNSPHFNGITTVPRTITSNLPF